MRKARYKETEIVRVLKEVCREYGISDAIYYNIKAKYGGREIADIRKLKEIANETRRLKQMCVYNNLWIDDDALNFRYTGGQPWAYLYFKYGPIDILFERFASDYSGYDRMRLELKRATNTECSDLHLEIKHIDDAEKGGLRSVPPALIVLVAGAQFALFRQPPLVFG